MKERFSKGYSQCRETSELQYMYSTDLRIQNKLLSMTLPRQKVTCINRNGTVCPPVGEEMARHFKTIHL